MFDRRHHARGLDTLDVLGGQSRGEPWVLAVVLEVPPAVRDAGDVHAGGEQNVLVVSPGLAGDRRTDLAGERGVPRRRERNRGRKRGGRPRLGPDAERAVHEAKRRNSRAIDRWDVAGRYSLRVGRAVYQIEFLPDGQIGQQVLDTIGGGRSRLVAGHVRR